MFSGDFPPHARFAAASACTCLPRWPGVYLVLDGCLLHFSDERHWRGGYLAVARGCWRQQRLSASGGEPSPAAGCRGYGCRRHGCSCWPQPRRRYDMATRVHAHFMLSGRRQRDICAVVSRSGGRGLGLAGLAWGPTFIGKTHLVLGPYFAVRIEPIEADERKENGARYW